MYCDTYSFPTVLPIDQCNAMHNAVLFDTVTMHNTTNILVHGELFNNENIVQLIQKINGDRMKEGMLFE